MMWICCCISFVVASGFLTAFIGWLVYDNPRVAFAGIVLFIIGVLGAINFVQDVESSYIPAEPIAYNSTQTVFTTSKWNIIANGLYPDGEYLLVLDTNDDVLVVWQAVEPITENGLG